MKKANEIINHILSPYSDKLAQERCLKKIISLLPQKYNNYITSAVLKGEILIFNVSHQAVKQELFYNKNLVFSIIRTMHGANMCRSVNPKKIITNYRYRPKPKTPAIYKFYIKPAGNFENRAKKQEIKEAFEEIKKLLKGN
jgi:ribosomal protein L23